MRKISLFIAIVLAISLLFLTACQDNKIEQPSVNNDNTTTENSSIDVGEVPSEEGTSNDEPDSTEQVSDEIVDSKEEATQKEDVTNKKEETSSNKQNGNSSPNKKPNSSSGSSGGLIQVITPAFSEQDICPHPEISPATCSEPKTCKSCKKTFGDALGHIIDGTKCARCNATVSGMKQPTAIHLDFADLGSIDIDVGSRYRMSYSFEPAGTYTTSLVWKSSNLAVATVDSNGIVTGVSRGTTNITVKLPNGKSDTIKVTVHKEVECQVNVKCGSEITCGAVTLNVKGSSSSYTVNNDYSVNIWFALNVTKTFDAEGSESTAPANLSYRVINSSGKLISTGTLSTGELKEGETIRTNRVTIKNLPEGNYSIELVNS